MSDELVNQLTLNFLISKNQLQKLNKKLKDTTEHNRQTDKEIYGERIQQLFADLLVNKQPEHLMQEVKTGFDFFVDKCIYYFKMMDNNEERKNGKEGDDDKDDDDEGDCEIHEDIDYEKEEREIEKGNYIERSSYGNDEYDDIADNYVEHTEDTEDGNDDLELEDCDNDEKQEHTPSVNVHKKYKHRFHSKGVDNIQSLPLDWFKNAKLEPFIPRKK